MKLWGIFKCGGKRGNFEETVESGKKIAKVLANFKLIAKNQMRWQSGLMANGDFDEYGQVFKKIGEKFK